MARDENYHGLTGDAEKVMDDPDHMFKKRRDRFGFGVEQIDEATKNAQVIAKDHMNVWNKLIENKSPIGMKKDELQWEPRVQDLMSNEGFQTFVKANTIQEKMVALRDAGIYQGMDMSDEELARYLMTHAASGLTEDPNVHREAKSMVKNVNDMNESEYMQFLNENKTPMNVTKGDLEKLHNSTIK